MGRKSNMSEFLETTVDKFTFRVATDRLYAEGHLWVRWEDGLARIGLSDYIQQSSGDVAFAEPKPMGTELAMGDDLGSIETIKVNLVLPSPINGVIREINPALEDAPELVNQDPYGEGWLVLVEAADWEAERAKLLDPEGYFEMMKAEAEEQSSRR
jgi:glycine cleavage system H protein